MARAQKAPDPDPPQRTLSDEAEMPPETVAHEYGVNILAPWGDCEQPHPDDEGRPLGFEPLDGLTQFWADDPQRQSGRCLKLDSAVLKEQVYERWEVLRADPKSPAPAKKLGEGKYSAIAATYGATLFSRKVWIEPGAAYRVSADVKTVPDYGYLGADGTPRYVAADKGPAVHIWVKGYLRHNGRDRVVYKARKECQMGAQGDPRWYTYTRTITPTRVTPKVQWVRIMLLVYWPPGIAYVDRLRLEKIPIEEHSDTEVGPPVLRELPRQGGATSEASPQAPSPNSEQTPSPSREQEPERGTDRDGADFMALPVAFARELGLFGASSRLGRSVLPLVPKAAGWWNPAWSYRVALEPLLAPSTATAGGEYAFEFPVGEDIQEGGADLRVVDGAGAVLPVHMVWARPGERLEAFVRVEDPGKGLFAYWGNPKADQPAPSFEPSSGLVLEVRTRPEGPHPANLAQWRALWKRATQVQGREIHRQIWDAYNPMGGSDRYMSRYQGFLRIGKAGKYVFCTASDDSSFLLIDGKEVCAWPGGHGAEEGLWGRFQGEIELSAGIHRIEYCQEEHSGGQAAVAGWQPPGLTQVSLIGADVFAQPARLKTGRVETQDGAIAPLFTYRRRSQLDLGDGLLFTEVEFFDRTGPGLPRRVERRWDFGDGITEEARNPRHVFLRGGKYRVTLTVSDAESESSSRITRVLDADILFHQGNDPDRAQRHLDVVERYDFSKLSARDLERVFALIAQTDDAGEVERRLCEAYAALGAKGDARTRARSLARLGELCLTETENFEAARDWYRQLGESSAVEDQRQAWIGLCEVAAAQNDAAAAQAALAEAAKRANPWDSPQTRRLLVLEGDIARIQGKREAAQKAYRKAADLVIGRSTENDELARHAYPPRVHNFLLRREYREAQRELEDWAARFPEVRLDGYYTTLWQRVRLAQKRYRGAALRGDALVACNPGDHYASECLYLSAVARYGLDDDAGALERFDRLLKEYPESNKCGESDAFARKLREKSAPASGASPPG